MQNIKITTDMRRSDLVNVSLLSLFRERSNVIFYVLTITIILLSSLLVGGMPESSRGWFVLFVAVALGGIVCLTLGFAISLVWILATASEKAGILGCHEYELSENELRESTVAGSQTNLWTGILGVSIRGNYLLIKITHYLFHIIPARSFENREKFVEFSDRANELWKAANTEA